MTRITALFTVLALCVAAAPMAYADDRVEERGPFDRGRWTGSVSLGSQSNGGERYFVLGGALGRYVVSGLEIGIGLEQWFGDGPSITLFEPHVRYVFHQLDSPVKPYVGGLYRHWFVSDYLRDIDTVGARVGIVWLSSGLLLGAGVLYEQLVNPSCSMDCGAFVPELSLALSF